MGVESPKKSSLNTHGSKFYSLEDEKYVPNPKHNEKGWGSRNPIIEKGEGQDLIDKGTRDGKQIYNITPRGELVKYQPDNTPEKGYHPYEIYKNKDLPVSVIREWYKIGRISKAEYNRLIKGKIRKVKVPKNEKDLL